MSYETTHRFSIDPQQPSSFLIRFASHHLQSTYLFSLLATCIQVELLLSAADEGIGDKLREYAAEQAAGEQLNAVAETHSNPNADPISPNPDCPNSSPGPIPRTLTLTLSLHLLP